MINYNQKNESGYTLILAMFLLLALTLIGVEAMKGTALQERMAGNQNSKLLSYMSAEVGAREFLDWLESEFKEDKEWFCEPSSTSASSNNACVVSVDESVLNKDIGNNQKYIISDLEWSYEGVKLTVTGRLEVEGKVLSETQMRIEYGNPYIGGFNLGNAPAAISCIGTPCKILSGSSGKNGEGLISGRDHEFPSPSCTGAGCVTAYSNPGDANAKPAIMLTSFGESSVGTQGGNPKDHYCGFSRNTKSSVVCGNDKEDGFVWDISDLEEPNSILEFNSKMNEKIEEAIESGNENVFINPSDLVNKEGIAIVDGGNISAGTGAFVGLVVIKNCGTIEFKGTFSLYGSVFIDGAGCGSGYTAFKGGGTTRIRFSSSALERAGNITGISRKSDHIPIHNWVEKNTF